MVYIYGSPKTVRSVVVNVLGIAAVLGASLIGKFVQDYQRNDTLRKNIVDKIIYDRDSSNVYEVNSVGDTLKAFSRQRDGTYMLFHTPDMWK